ncbi:hypothetical protein BpHYR1_032318 [Brachionus plicatilis]|uniref:Uncharacterized protein n=1 Tax=Brachionus plicatilis TaxID=10195 RepID=A0A3M7T4I4_BRAPC|nr:hypothetical protein BpHYR1_032318 [Brachionus plicatilis]
MDDLIQDIDFVIRSNQFPRKSKHMYGRFRDKKCKLSKFYTVELHVSYASKAGLFGEENLCPADINHLEIYIQIFKPVFIMTNDI